MKVIIADTLSPLVDAIFRLPNPTLTDSWLGAIGYTLQLYFDFAGYSAMAIGLALMIGFHFPENFQLSLSQRLDPGILEPLAHHAVQLPAGLSLHPVRRQPAGVGTEPTST